MFILADVERAKDVWMCWKLESVEAQVLIGDRIPAFFMDKVVSECYWDQLRESYIYYPSLKSLTFLSAKHSL